MWCRCGDWECERESTRLTSPFILLAVGLLLFVRLVHELVDETLCELGLVNARRRCQTDGVRTPDPPLPRFLRSNVSQTQDTKRAAAMRPLARTGTAQMSVPQRHAKLRNYTYDTKSMNAVPVTPSREKRQLRSNTQDTQTQKTLGSGSSTKRIPLACIFGG